ncbi:MAG: radical SAM family heme chaperone HemW [Bacteroidota bacterium]
MAGIYLHIPFCKQACHYCDFHFSTNLARKTELVHAMHQELRMQQAYLKGETVSTIYFGGGTPSLLSAEEISGLLNTIRERHAVSEDPEISLEANPDDLDEAKLYALASAGINRLSIGIQSFHDAHLLMMNRSHNAAQAAQSVALAQAAGISNISIDIICGIPYPDHSVLQSDLKRALALGVPHISVYCLTIEPGTVFGRRHKKGTFAAAPEEFAAEQLEMVRATLEAYGIMQYEISNYAKPGMESRHNSAYWQQQPYLGIGPSAHSYNGHERQFDISSNAGYIQSISAGKIPATIEPLSPEDRINDYLLTTLRTRQGCNLNYLKSVFDYDLTNLKAGFIKRITESGQAEIEGHFLKLSPSGRLIADYITAELMAGEE